jgi:hypothetical protein
MTTKPVVREKKVEEPPKKAPAPRNTALDAFLDHQRKAIEEARKAIEALLPGAVKEHGQAAFKEALEGYRNLFNSTLDEVIETVEKVKMQPPKK